MDLHHGRDGLPLELSHDFLVYDSDEAYLATVVPFVESGLAGGEPVSVVIPPRRAALVRAALGSAAAAVDFSEPAAAPRTPAQKIALLDQLCARHANAARPRVLGEADFGTTTAEHLDWLRYEAIVNRVFGSTRQWFLCAYDRRELPDWVVGTAARAHGHMCRSGSRIPSTRYEEPEQLARELAPPLPEAGGPPALEMRVDRRHLAAARRKLTELARAAGVSRERVIEIGAGVNEVVTNALEHGGGHAAVRCWHDRDGGLFVCEVTDEGPGLDDPLAGYFPPASDQHEGRGLWLARQTLDSVELRASRGGGLRAVLSAAV